MLLGFIIGVVSGTAQFIMLARFTKTVTDGTLGKRAVIFAASQFLLPLVVLLLCAFFLRESLVWTATGMVAALGVYAFARFLLTNRNK